MPPRLIIVDGEKPCSKCKEILPADLDHFYRERRSPNGLSSDCGKCRTANATQWQTAHPEHVRKKLRKAKLAKYGITESKYDRLYAKQEGVCAICGLARLSKGKTKLDIDHCHRTGKVRGLLCNSCNSGLGFLKENPDILRRATEYLQRPECLRESSAYPTIPLPEFTPYGRARLKYKYGISVVFYHDMYVAQLGKCAICLTENFSGQFPSVDHCHNTGRVRGLLCKKCNVGIGKFSHTSLINAALEYIGTHDSVAQL